MVIGQWPSLLLRCRVSGTSNCELCCSSVWMTGVSISSNSPDTRVGFFCFFARILNIFSRSLFYYNQKIKLLLSKKLLLFKYQQLYEIRHLIDLYYFKRSMVPRCILSLTCPLTTTSTTQYGNNNGEDWHYIQNVVF